MISWMQKHNKYLVWTIWVATIAFIGAGFVGWGSYSFGRKAGNVAKVGSIEIPQTKLNMVYGNLYNRYNQMMQGKLDDKKAKELGLVKQAFATIATQAKILNFAKDMGIVVSDSEVAKTLENIKAFQKNGVFSKEIYNTYLKGQRLKAKTFEASLREEMIINKTLSLLNVESLPLEEETVTSAINVADKISYKVLKPSDVNITMDETKLKAYWEAHKENFMTEKTYELAIVWTPSSSAHVTNEELKAYYETNSFNYTDEEGKQLSFEKAKERVTKDLKLKKSKKSAQKNYIAFKKGKIDSNETVKLATGDPKLTKEIWNKIAEKKNGDILKPKIVSDRYATIKIISVTEPRVMTFNEAKEEVGKLYAVEAKKEALMKLAESTLKNFDKANASISDFVTLDKFDNFTPLNSQESLQFLQKLFTSSKEKGIISVLDNMIVYNITAQKFLPMDQNKTDALKKTVNTIKQRTFESNLIKILDKKYPTEVYMEGLAN